MLIVDVCFRQEKLCIFGNNITNTTDSSYAEIKNQPSGDSTYQELTDKDYHNIGLQ